MENSDIGQVFGEIADILEITGGNAFKVRAYRQAAQVIDTLPQPVAELWRENQLEGTPGIGAGIRAKIEELLSTGRCREHDRLAEGVPPGVLELLRLEGVGPKTVAAVWKQLGICDVAGLEAACRDGRVLALPRMGPLRVKGLLSAIDRHRARGERMPLHRAVAHAEAIVARLRQVAGVERAEAAGSVRRRKETVGDLDILIASRSPAAASQAFLAMPEVASVIAAGSTKSAVRLRAGLQVDMRVLPPESFGAALHYFTGSKSHNIALRTRAVHLGIKVSEYGVFDREGRRLGGETEEEVFRAVGLPWIPPELREGSGELEAAERGELPHLVEEADILGDLHVHSSASADARARIEDLADEAWRLKRRYLAITDHSQSRPLGLDPDGLAKQVARIREINGDLEGALHLLSGIEVDILPDGSLDLPNEVLAGLDWVVASVHSHFHVGAEAMTERLVRAIRSGVVDAIGHPSGRLLGSRDAYEYDLERVLDAAREEGVALEVNAQPERLDLSDKACRLAKEAGVRVVINSDAHVRSHLANLRYGVWVARRGWLEKGDVVNARALGELRSHLRRAAASAAHP